MADGIPVTDSIRGFSQLLFSETAAAIQQMMQIKELPEALELSMVRICCGNAQTNQRADGIVLPEHTPWLAELYFGKNKSGTDNTAAFRAANPRLAALPCRNLQGVGPAWETRLAGFGLHTVEQLATCSQNTRRAIRNRTKNNRILEFIAKAQTVLMPPPPLPRTTLDALRIEEAVWLTPAEAVERAHQLEQQDWRQAVDFLSRLHAALDDACIKKMTVRDVLG